MIGACWICSFPAYGDKIVNFNAVSFNMLTFSSLWNFVRSANSSLTLSCLNIVRMLIRTVKTSHPSASWISFLCQVFLLECWNWVDFLDTSQLLRKKRDLILKWRFLVVIGRKGSWTLGYLCGKCEESWEFSQIADGVPILMLSALRTRIMTIMEYFSPLIYRQ